jgi:steroid delta-isomerase-like uncharacterized protein
MNPVSMTVESGMLQANKALVARFIEEVWNARNPAAANAFLAAEYVDHAYKPANVDGLRTAITGTAVAFPDYVFTIEDVVAEADTVVARMRMRATHLGSFRGTPATGNAIDAAMYRTFRLIDGKIAEHYALFDTTTLLRQIEATPAAENACRR